MTGAAREIHRCLADFFAIRRIARAPSRATRRLAMTV
jgi:hypothetical protein